MQCPYTSRATATSDFNNLVNTLIAEGHLVPGNPAASTVLAFMPLDEPDLCGMADQGNQAHPTLADAIDVIRDNSNTSAFPVYLNASQSYHNVDHGLRLADWVSSARYNVSTNGYVGHVNGLLSLINPGQKVLMLPQAAQGGLVDSSYHLPSPIFEKFRMDSRVIGIMPFLWENAQTTGTRDIPALRAEWENYGGQIKQGDLISPSLYCNPTGPLMDSWNCYASAAGGDSPYDYDWSDSSATGSSNSYFLTCSGGGETKLVSVRIEDSDGFYDFAYEWITCGPIE